MVGDAQEDQVLINIEKGKDKKIKRKDEEKVRGTIRVKNIIKTAIKNSNSRVPLEKRRLPTLKEIAHGYQ